MIKVAIVDDNRVVRESLAQVFSFFEDMQLVWVAADGEEAVKLIESDLIIPEVVLMDIEMGVMNGIEATRLIKAMHPEIKVLVLSVVKMEEKVIEAIAAGADGYLLKGEKPLTIIELIKNVVEGRLPLSPEVTAIMLKNIRGTLEPSKKAVTDYNLTRRETEVLQHLVAGRTYQQIADVLVVSPLTIRSHMENLYRKLSVHNKAEAVALAVRNAWF
jgi:DNA-binding NarL/FixJ family response regulator